MTRVGGTVGENNIKFFVQFCFYAAVYTLFALIVMAYFVAEAKSKVCTIHLSMVRERY